MNSRKKLIGIINRDYLMVLLKYKCWAGDFRKLENSTMHQSNRHSLNSDYVAREKRTLTKQMLDGVDKDARKKLILSQIDNEEENDIDFSITDIKETLPVTWEDFNSKFIDEPGMYCEVREICEANLDRKIDLRTYMENSPHFVIPSDGIQKVLDVFRLHHLRYLPVVDCD